MPGRRCRPRTGGGAAAVAAAVLRGEDCSSVGNGVSRTRRDRVGAAGHGGASWLLRSGRSEGGGVGRGGRIRCGRGPSGGGASCRAPFRVTRRPGGPSWNLPRLTRPL